MRNWHGNLSPFGRWHTAGTSLAAQVAALFGPSDTGWLYDNSDFSTMFQDSAGTIPVTAVGQSVGLQLDKSGNNNHRFQSTSLNRPTLQQDSSGFYYLSYNGTNNSLATSAFDWGTDKATICAGVRKLSDAARGTIVERTASIASNNGAFHMTAPNAASDTFAFESKGTILTDAVSSGVAAPATRVLTGIGDIAGDSAIIRANGAVIDTDASDQGTGDYTSAATYFGARAGTSQFFKGYEYSQFAISRLLTESELALVERFTAQRTGVGYTEVTWDDTTDTYTQSEVFL